MTDPAAACTEIVRASRSNFALSFRFLPRRQRRAMEAVYAFCRRTDDIVDGSGDNASKRERLERWREQLSAGGPDPVVRAVLEVAEEFNLDRRHLAAVIDGCEADLAETRCETYEDLFAYCDLVAGAVGHLCLGIWGVRGPEVGVLAENLGRAVQLTNIIRDVGEDAQRGRVYIPVELLRSVAPNAVTEEEILAGQLTENVQRCLRDMGARAALFYKRARAAVDGLPRQVRRRLWPGIIIYRVYRHLLCELERRNYPVFAERVRIGGFRRLLIALGVILGSRFG